MLQKLKNIIGRYLGYSGCPMCGNTWWVEKNVQSVQYEVYPVEPLQGLPPGLKMSVKIGKGLMICKKSYDSHDQLTLLQFTRDYLSKRDERTYPYLEEQIQQLSPVPSS